MASVPNYGQRTVQDMPPKDGFKPFSFKKGVPVTRGPPGWIVFSTLFGMTAYGYYQVGQGNILRRVLKKEKREMRIALLPFLQAEEDHLYVKKETKVAEEEAIVMQNVPGWDPNASVFHTGMWAPPPQEYGN